jgi:hypothetical protein
MTHAVAAPSSNGVLEALVLSGDLSKMNDNQKVQYYQQFCQHLGLNPLTQPFKILKFQGREVLYATKDCTEQLRKIHGISVVELTTDLQPGSVYVVTCKVKDNHGKTDMSTGVVSIEGLKGEPLANALMKAETKSKRRATLSICGLGIMDESEIETVDANATVVNIPTETPKRPLSDNAFANAVMRIGKGERELIGKLRETYLLNERQMADLLVLEDANTVAG